MHVAKKDEKESIASAVGTAKGVVQTATIAAALFTTPVTIPLATGVLTGLAVKSVSESLEVVVFLATNAELFKGHDLSSDEKEDIVYNKVKDVTGVGAVYSALRTPVYLFKRNQQKSVESCFNLVSETGEIAVGIGIKVIPVIDVQLQKLLEKTTKHLYKFLTKKVMDKVSLHGMPLAKGLSTIANAENDCRSVFEITSSMNAQKLPVTGIANNNASSCDIDILNHPGNENTDKRKWGICDMMCCRRWRNKDSPRKEDNGISKYDKSEDTHSQGDDSNIVLSHRIHAAVPNSHIFVIAE